MYERKDGTLFQYLMVQLKGMNALWLILVKLFQYLMVQLKVQQAYKNAYDAAFQYLMVQLKDCLPHQARTGDTDFNTSWYN